MTIGGKIKYYRNHRGISQEFLGKLSGVNSATIKKYEYGIRNPKADQLLKIANGLGIGIYGFMDLWILIELQVPLFQYLIYFLLNMKLIKRNANHYLHYIP